jgi:hypothetical protein
MTDGLEKLSVTTMSRPLMPTRWTLIDEALSKMTAEVSKQLFQEGARYSEATLLKHKWVRRLYEGFTVSFDESPWPLQSKMAAAFIRFCGIHACYSVNSIEDVILPSLKRIHEEECNEKISTELAQYLSNAMRDVRRTKKSSMVTKGKDAAIGKDVERIIELVPENHVEKASEASAWLCALYTGARAITITSVLLMDILAVFKPSSEENSDRVIVRINFRRTKGMNAWNHVISIEGRMRTPGPMDFVYFLNRHLYLYFGVKLEDYESWSEKLTPEQLHTNLWRWNTDSIRELFKKRCEYAGYKSGLLSFHSLRAGFICTAIIQAGTNKEQVAAILEHTAYVAGWSPMGNEQNRYVKETVKRAIVCNRLVYSEPTEAGGGSTDRRTVIEAGLTDPQQFHCLKKPLQGKWPREFETLDTFCGQLQAYMTARGIKRHLQPRVYREILRVIYSKFCQSNEDLLLKAKRRATRSKYWAFRERRHGILSVACARTGRWAIQRRLLQGTHSIPGTILEISQYIEEDTASDKEVASKQGCVLTEGERPMNESSGKKASRKRIMWTDTETNKLLSMQARECTWSEIARELPLRTPCDCKDRYRNILALRERARQKDLEVSRNVDKEDRHAADRQAPNRVEHGPRNEGTDSVARRNLVPCKKRARRIWTIDEDAILTRMVGDKRSWVDISKCIAGRSNVDCKDRYRNISK